MNNLHIRNDRKCPECCCGGCFIHKGCGGILHERLVDDDIDDGYIHNYRCDKCDMKDYISDDEYHQIEFKE